MDEIEIKFSFEYDCGGHYSTGTVKMPKEEFESDKLLVLVCSYMSYCYRGGYPGIEIERYLRMRFPELKYIFHVPIVNVYDCEVDGLKTDYQDIGFHFLGISDTKKILRWIKEQCDNYVLKETDRGNYSIWDEN